MLSRESLLALSIVLSMLVHGAFFAIAPRVSVSGIHVVQEKPREPFRVQLRQEAALPPKEEPRANTLVTGPGKIEDLLKRENEPLTPGESRLGKALEIPQLSNRVASEVLEREHALAPDEAVMSKVDAKIIEVSQDDARQGIEIARRLVSPSPERILGENEFPALRGTSDGGDEPIRLGSLTARNTLGETAQPPSSGLVGPDGTPAPPYEENPLSREPTMPDEPVLPELQEIARAPVVEQVRKENPYQFMDNLISIKLDTYAPAGEKEGFFRLQIVPKEGEEVSVLPKDVTFIIDASSSILQRKLDATTKATKSMVALLKPEDRFNIVIFRDSPTMFQPSPVPGTPENKTAALQFLSGLQSGGETNVYDALRPVVQSPPRSGVPGIVVVMTDGRPTVGVRDARTLINQLTEENTAGNTIFAFGAGNTVNGYLLDLLAYRNKGEAQVQPSFDNMATDLLSFFARLNDPILSELQANYGQISEADSIVPKAIPDFYKGRAVTVYGRFNPEKDHELFMRLVGVAASKKKEIIFKADLRKGGAGDEKIARNWAFQRIYYLIGEICRLGDKPELVNELDQLTRKYNIRTSYSN